ncbi:translation initiation factor IF-2 [Candidatus Uhrbacteria bacterium CG_4_9_14_0_2_um_filter_41_50]|uniref:Translation initiation factor IF-2 n=1 Tax=Candidatus Uhrbacteria bacterium CG_4_9_14_0_2_um_filter_41_50 TaxID=1975031 RepID=A0A2M8EQ20_9BACT|nr:MAG: translation initiation factor IF-2 [Candidatus Uhrbacteria bacterium CG_4_10_14_3_um_filter_41_21]PIZ54414.1 MAG: translation initiation factor IF-2 [Candidatus Uhrbacteria bacterium CG_4_10_14_0_2_um_filter_41_21]PJB85025.1 MAG: translation initiation factor IF-2 [Candidatus Uhrbacteria bacterium CG_4_9_14_0_8_um_filter_41_16]PJC24824.1 MAG: translation initiation factor IF-2 [Candidatus Uhrbacteria bacterium CG_4_9_14_0_2_um_filter_41_50]
MNISELARKLRVSTDELRAKLPELGFDIGAKAIKIPDRDAGRIEYSWRQYKKRQFLDKKRAEQKARADLKLKVQEGTAEKILLPSSISVRDFAEKLNLPIAKVMQELMRAGILASLNERIDFESASIVAEDLGYIAESEEEVTIEDHDLEGLEKLEKALEMHESKNMQPRAPVIVVMGHVDHGKTRILDSIRNTNVIDTEHGGITQHIGAYQVRRKEHELSFIDTPGHEAFTVMRSRGAKVADIAILVVAADDGVQPQTREAIDIIKAAKIPFVVAINKIDKDNANIEKVKNQLSAEAGLIPEDWGGKTIMVPVSAKQGTNIDDLLDMILLVADMEKDHIIADPDRLALGTIIESNVDKAEGPVATVLVQSGTLKVGDSLGLRGALYGKVRAMRTWDGKDVKVAPPSTPVKILGFKVAPAIGDILEVPENPKDLEKLKSQPNRKSSVDEMTVRKTKSADNGEESGSSERTQKVMLNLIVRADVLGSLEAILGMMEKIDSPYVGVKIVSKGLGYITESDILNADATGAMLIAFNVKPSTAASVLARDKGVDVFQYNVIYKLFEEVVEKLRVLIPAELIYTELGSISILAVFQKSPKGMIVGGQVNKGRVELGATARVMREDKIIAEGKIGSLQEGKMDVKFVEQGNQCGMEFVGKAKIEVGDILEIYKEEEHARVLNVAGAK